MRGELKKALDDLARSEREAIALIGTKRTEASDKRRRAADERWQWIVRHSADTVFRGVTAADMELGRDR
jgi:hypothetical protein